MLTYGKIFDKEIFIVEYESDFHGNFITHFINQHKHFVQSTLTYYYADWKTAINDRNHIDSTLFIINPTNISTGTPHVLAKHLIYHSIKIL